VYVPDGFDVVELPECSVWKLLTWSPPTDANAGSDGVPIRSNVTLLSTAYWNASTRLCVFAGTVICASYT
jgi:hypothetical protein